MIPPFKWLYTFLNTPEEWHSAVIGLGEGYCPWEKRIKASVEVKRMVKKEYWYYIAGTAMGFALLILSIAAAIALVIRVI